MHLSPNLQFPVLENTAHTCFSSLAPFLDAARARTLSRSALSAVASAGVKFFLCSRWQFWFSHLPIGNHAHKCETLTWCSFGFSVLVVLVDLGLPFSLPLPFPFLSPLMPFLSWGCANLHSSPLLHSPAAQNLHTIVPGILGKDVVVARTIACRLCCSRLNVTWSSIMSNNA